MTELYQRMPDCHLYIGCNILMFQDSIVALVVATKEIGLEVNADKTKYMIMSRDQNTG